MGSCSPAPPVNTSEMSVAVSLVVVAALLLARASADLPRFEKRKTSHVTEVLQVDMVDRRLRSTSLDHSSLEMDLIVPRQLTSARPDDVLQPLPVTAIH